MLPHYSLRGRAACLWDVGGLGPLSAYEKKLVCGFCILIQNLERRDGRSCSKTKVSPLLHSAMTSFLKLSDIRCSDI